MKVPTQFIVAAGFFDVQASSRIKEVRTKRSARTLGQSLLKDRNFDFYEILEVEDDGAIVEVTYVDRLGVEVKNRCV